MKNKKRNYSKYFSIFLMLFVYTFQAQIGTAQIPEYYNDVNLSLTGTALKNELTTKITSTHTNLLSYTEVWYALQITDLDPDDGTQTNVIFNVLIPIHFIIINNSF